jgi:hypothetical protein
MAKAGSHDLVWSNNVMRAYPSLACHLQCCWPRQPLVCRSLARQCAGHFGHTTQPQTGRMATILRPGPFVGSAYAKSPLIRRHIDQTEATCAASNTASADASVSAQAQ